MARQRLHMDHPAWGPGEPSNEEEEDDICKKPTPAGRSSGSHPWEENHRLWDDAGEELGLNAS